MYGTWVFEIREHRHRDAGASLSIHAKLIEEHEHEAATLLSTDQTELAMWVAVVSRPPTAVAGLVRVFETGGHNQWMISIEKDRGRTSSVGG